MSTFCRFYTIVAISGADAGVLAPPEGNVLVPDALIVVWIAQLAGLSLLPLAALLCLEHGVLAGMWRTLHVVLAAGSLFFTCHMQTRAYYLDRSVLFGRASYLATGRGFVIEHGAFTESFRAVAMSRELPPY